MRIFVADDDPVLLNGLDRALSGRGYAVRTAPNGSEMLSLLDEERPDMLVLDIMMPGMSGLDVLERVRSDARYSNMPILMMTAMADEGVEERARTAGAVGLLPKPFRIAELLERIERTDD